MPSSDTAPEKASLLDPKILILVVSVLLMAVVAVLAVAGIFWALDLQQPPTGALVVLAISGVASIACLWRLWTTRKDHLG